MHKENLDESWKKKMDVFDAYAKNDKPEYYYFECNLMWVCVYKKYKFAMAVEEGN